MKTKKITRLCGLLLVACLMLSGVGVLAANDSNADNATSLYRYTRIAVLSAKLSITGSTASCYGKVSLSYATDTADLLMELQQLQGSDWVTIKDWTTSGNAIVLLDKTYGVDSAFTYRVRVTADVYDSNGVLQESESLLSTTV